MEAPARAAGAVLLDLRPAAALAGEVVRRLEANGDRVADLRTLSRVTIEVEPCPGH